MSVNLDALSDLIKTVAVAYKDDSSAFGTGHKPEVYSELGDLVLKVLSVYGSIGTFIPPADGLHKDDFSSLSYHVQNELALGKPHADVVVTKSIEVLITIANFATTEIQSTIGQTISQPPDEDAGASDEDDSDEVETDSDDQSGLSQPGSDSPPEDKDTAPAVPSNPVTDSPSDAPAEEPEPAEAAVPADAAAEPESEAKEPTDAPEPSEAPEEAAPSEPAETAPESPESPETSSEPQPEGDAPAADSLPPTSSPLPVVNLDPGLAGEKPNAAEDAGVLTAFEDLKPDEETAPPEEQVDGDPKPTPNAEA